MRLIRYLLIAIALVSLFWLVPSEHALSEIIEIPRDLEVMPEVNEAFYKSETHYEDPSLTIDITSGRAYDTDYLILRVKIANATQLRSYVTKKENYGDVMAQRVHAVLALTGDDFRDNKSSHTRKYVYRQGKEVFIQNWKDACYYDILMIDGQGDFHILKQPTRKEVDEFMEQHDIVNTFCFGPGLWINGEQQEPLTGSRANGIGWTKKAQRLCFCQSGPLEYIVFVTGGPDNPHCKGMTMPEFIEVIKSEIEPLHVYNLDGGNAAWVVFHGEKINRFNRGAPRENGRSTISSILRAPGRGKPPLKKRPGKLRQRELKPGS